MLNCETHLLNAVHLALKTSMGLDDTKCNIEFEDSIPATAGDLYIAIHPSGAAIGPRALSSGQVFDVYEGCRVVAYQRCANVPRDRRRSVFMTALTGINAILDQIIMTVDHNVGIIVAANNSISTALPGAQGFISPLRLLGIDRSARMVTGEVYGAHPEDVTKATAVAAICRGLDFGQARRLQGR